VAGLAQVWDLGRRASGSDFYQFWIVAQVIGRADVTSVYDEEAHARLGAEFIRRSFTDDTSERRRRAAREWQVLEPTATPLLYSVFRPLAGLEYDSAHLLFRTVSIAALAVGVMAIALLLGHSTTTALLALAVVSVAFRPLKASVQVGQVNELQLAAIALYLWLSSAPDGSRRQIAAGALLAALVLFKPNLMGALPLLAAVWLVRGRRRKLTLQAAGAAAGGVVAVAVTTLVFGTPSAWWDWLAFMRVFPPEKIPLRFGNVGVARIAYETMGLRLAPWLSVLSLGLALLAVWRGRPREASAPADDPTQVVIEDTAGLAAGCLVYLLSAPLVWNHYLLLALPAALLLLREPGAPARGHVARRLLVGGSLLAIAADPVTDLFHMYDMYAHAALAVAGVVVLFGLSVRELARPRP
jgi:hypothetical protein